MLSNLFLRNCLIPQKWCWIELEYWPPEGLILCARLSAQITHLPCFNLIAGKRKRNYSDCKKCNMNSVFIILTFFLAGSCGGVCVVQTCCCGGVEITPNPLCTQVRTCSALESCTSPPPPLAVSVIPEPCTPQGFLWCAWLWHEIRPKMMN